MPATSNATTNMSRRQSFHGKGLTFIEMMFDDEMLTTATTPDTKDSVFNAMSKLVGTFGTIVAQSYALGCKATEKDAAIATSIVEDELCDYYSFIVEGTPGQFNAADSAGDTNIDVTATIVADAEADIEADIRAVISGDSSANQLQVSVRTLLPEGHVNGDASTFVGMFDQRGDA